MQVQIIESNRGGKITLHDGQSYNQKQSITNCIHKNCKLKCPESLKTKNETVIEKKVPIITNATPANVKRKKLWTKLKEEPNIQHQLCWLSMKFDFPEFNLALRILPARAHVPPAHVKTSFELVIEEITDVIEREQFEESVVEKMDELAIYFKSTYLENPIVNKKPPFPIEIWNQYDAAGEGVARTTNSVEGWHYALQAYFSGSTPNIWLFLRNLEKNSKMQSLNMFKKLPVYCAPSAPKTKNEKTDAKYPKIRDFWHAFFLFSSVKILFLSSE